MAEAETTYTKKIDGKVYERVASTASERVELEFAGWTPKNDTKSSSSASTSDAKTTK